MPSIFATPELGDPELAVIAEIAALRDQVRLAVGDHEPRLWVGSLRRLSLARNVQASNSIEGFNATFDDALLAIDGEAPVGADAATQEALAGYRDAMTYVLQVADDPGLAIDEGLLKSLHFMMLRHDLVHSPGRWRRGPIHGRREPSGEIAYHGPPFENVPDLIRGLLESIEGETATVLVRAAMAHLNLVMIHPFRDGNGRMARCLQTLVLARGMTANPVFSSIEEYLGRNTPAYYEVLARVGEGVWNPRNDARPWVRFCLTAHLRQATTVLRRVDETHALWAACEELVRARSLNERMIGGLLDAARGIRLRRASYIRLVALTAGEEIADLTGSRDLHQLVLAGLLQARGAARGRSYEASPELAARWQEIRAARPVPVPPDPFAGP
jgi:Fic family protein